MSLTYEEAVNLIYDLPKFTTKHSMEESRTFLHLIGNPQDGMRVIHVAGTNGKGSVCIYMESILMHAGKHTGCFVSPHLIDIRERVRIDGDMCSKEDFVWACSIVKDVAEKNFYPTFFEFLFFVGILIFKKNNVDILILETGLGGRLDATNLIENKELCVIPSIGMDHMQYLGNTIEEIAIEKAGIMRKDVPVVYWCDEPFETLNNIAHKIKAINYALSEDIVSNVIVDNTGIDFCLQDKYDNYICLNLQSRALYQVKNASLSVMALQIWDTDRVLSEADYREGIASAFWAGRMEKLCERVYVDGAHNEPAMKELLISISADGAHKRMLIFGCMQDKDYTSLIHQIVESGLFEEIITVDIGGRSKASSELAKLFEDTAKEMSKADDCLIRIPIVRSIGTNNHEQDIRYVVDEAKRFASSQDSYSYIAGSLYLAGDIKKFFDC